MRSIVSLFLPGACLLLAVVMGSVPARPGETSEPCAGESGRSAAMCREAHDLLMLDAAGAKKAEISVLVTGSGKGWLSRYSLPGEATALAEPRRQIDGGKGPKVTSWEEGYASCSG